MAIVLSVRHSPENVYRVPGTRLAPVKHVRSGTMWSRCDWSMNFWNTIYLTSERVVESTKYRYR